MGSEVIVTHRYRRVEWKTVFGSASVTPSLSVMTGNQRRQLQFIGHDFKYCLDICCVIRKIGHLSWAISTNTAWYCLLLTHWGRVTHICVVNLSIIGPDNGLSPAQRQAIVWTNAGILLIWSLGTNFREIWSKIQTFSFQKMYLKTSSVKWRPSCFGPNMLKDRQRWRLMAGPDSSLSSRMA